MRFLLLSASGDFIPPKSKIAHILRTNWSYLMAPFILYLFHNNNGPLSMQHIREYPNIPTYGVYILAFGLLYHFATSGFSKKLIFPMVVGYLAVAFIYGFIQYSVHSEPTQNTV